MLNPHPPLTGFPWVILVLVIGAELGARLMKSAELQGFAVKLLVVLAIFSPVTYLSGYLGLKHADRGFSVPVDAIESHQLVAKLFLLSLFPTVVLSVVRTGGRSKNRIIHFAYYAFLLCSFSLVIWTSKKGGDLVFEHGAGVKIQPYTTSNSNSKSLK